MHIELYDPQAVNQAFVQVLSIFPFKLGINHKSSEPHWKIHVMDITLVTRYTLGLT